MTRDLSHCRVKSTCDSSCSSASLTARKAVFVVDKRAHWPEMSPQSWKMVNIELFEHENKWTIKLWHRNVNIFSGQPWWHIVFLRTFISRAVSSENVKCCDYTKREILKKGKYWTFWVWDEIKSILETFKNNFSKGDLKAYRGIGVKMLGAPFQPEK